MKPIVSHSESKSKYPMAKKDRRRAPSDDEGVERGVAASLKGLDDDTMLIVIVYQVRRNLLVYSFPDVHGGQPPRQLPIPWKN